MTAAAAHAVTVAGDESSSCVPVRAMELSGPHGRCAAAVVLPSPGVDLPRPALRNLPCRALVRLGQGPLWSLRVIGYPWSNERLAASSEVLSAHGGTLDDRSLSLRLSDQLELPDIEVGRPTPGELDGSAWDTRRLAVALSLARVSPSVSDPGHRITSREVDALSQRVAQQLTAALGEFLHALDAEVGGVATRDGQLDIRLYNYLVDANHRRNRMQFAAALPVFFRAVAENRPGVTIQEMRVAVDRALPLVDVACRAMDIAPSALKRLVNVPLDVCGERWAERPEVLARLIDSLVPAARPGPDTASWQRLNTTVDCAEAALQRSIAASFYGRAWVRQATQTSARSGKPSAALTASAREVAAVETFRDDLIRLIAMEIRRPTVGHKRPETTYVERAVDNRLLGTSLRRLASDALRWHEEYTRLVDADLREGKRYWPLLPTEYVTRDGLRRIVPLVNSEQLQRQGAEMGICLADSHLASYDAACRKGRVFIVAMLDGRTGEPESTAEFSAGLARRGPTVVIGTVQHTGRHNAPASVACQAALQELESMLAGEAVQRHLRLGLTAMRTFNERGSDPADRADILAKARAFRHVLGDSEYESLARACQSPSNIAVGRAACHDRRPAQRVRPH